MQNINVIWQSYHQPEIIERGYWDQGVLEDLFKRPCEYTWQHHDGFAAFANNTVDERKARLTGAVVIINARTHLEDIERINADIASLHWVLLILTGDEEGQFEWQQIRHPLLRTWVQLPRMNIHNDVSFKLPNGARPDTRQLLVEIGQQKRTNDWFFAGQINHDRREQCVEATKQLNPELYANGFRVETERFGEEKLAYKEYLTIMAQSKIVLCPSGIETPDTFRLYEALEAGCLPIVDAFATRNQSVGFWQYMFGADLPFPVIDYWDKLPTLLPELLRDYPHNANKAFAWWQNFKRSMHFKLIDDIKEVSK